MGWNWKNENFYGMKPMWVRIQWWVPVLLGVGPFCFPPGRLDSETRNDITPANIMKNTYKLIITAVVAFGMTGLQTTSAEQAKAEVGKKAPDFTLTDTHGKEHTLSDYSGKYVILEWQNFDCPFVARQYAKTGSGLMPELQKKYLEKGVVWLTINSGAEGQQGVWPAEQMNERAEAEGYAGTAILYDMDGKVGRAYDAPVTPTMVVIDPEGTIHYWGAWDDDQPGSKDPKDRTVYIVDVLEALKAGEEVAVTNTRPYGCTVKYKN